MSQNDSKKLTVKDLADKFTVKECQDNLFADEMKEFMAESRQSWKALTELITNVKKEITKDITKEITRY